MLVYGKNVALSYLESNKNIRKIYLLDNFSDKNIISLIKKNKYETVVLDKNKINQLVKGNHQGIIIDVTTKPTLDLEALIKNNPDTIVVLDHIEDPHNLGAIIRTCEAAGINSIILPNKRSASIDGVVSKTSAGTLNNMNIAVVGNLRDSINKLKKQGYWAVGTAMNAQDSYCQLDYPEKTVIVIGNEGRGISDLLLKECDYKVAIPMRGLVNSLNASVAAGIIIFEVIKNRK